MRELRATFRTVTIPLWWELHPESRTFELYTDTPGSPTAEVIPYKHFTAHHLTSYNDS